MGENINMEERTDKIILNIVSNDYRKVQFCLVWSLDYIFVKSNYTEITKPIECNNWGRCYNTDFSLNSTNSLTIPVEYPKISDSITKSYINISLMSGDFIGLQDTNIKIS